MSVVDVRVRRQVVHGRLVGDARSGANALRIAVTDHLADDLAGLPSGEGYWLIRRLALRTTVGSGWSSPQISRALARSVTCALDGALRGGRETSGVLWFPSHAAFLARFLTDLAAGRTAGRWEYAGLASAGSSATEALARLAGRQPQDLVDALRLLSEADAEAVVVDLVPDQVALLRVLAGDPAGGCGVRAVLEALRGLLDRGRSVGALLLALAAARDLGVPLADAAVPASVAAQAVDDLRGGAERAASIVRGGRWGDLTSEDAGLLAVAGWSAEDRARLVDAVAGAPDLAGEPPGPSLHTPFGGAFLLVPLLEDLGDWVAATSHWPAPGDCPAQGAARLLCVAAALGTERAAAATRDPVLQLLLGVPHDVDLVGWLPSVPAEAASAAAATLRLDAAPAPPPAWFDGQAAEVLGRAAGQLLTSLGRRLPGMARGSPAHLQRNVLDLDAWVEVGAQTCAVELGDPPLAVLVSMAGLNSGQVVVPGVELSWTLTTSR